MDTQLAANIESEIMVEMLLERMGAQHATLDPGLLIDAYLLFNRDWYYAKCVYFGSLFDYVSFSFIGRFDCWVQLEVEIRTQI